MGSFWASPSRTLRIPLGFVFVAAALVIALVIGAHAIGYHRGAEKERTEAFRRAFGEPIPVDPLAQQAGPERVGGGGGGGQAVQPSPATDGGGQATQGGRQPARSAANPGDPRTLGLNYFHVARVDEGEAERIAAFLNANGVAAAVVPSNNPRLRIVVATRGFPRGEVFGPEANALKSKIQRVGRLYKAQQNGSTDFSDVYAVRYPD